MRNSLGPGYGDRLRAPANYSKSVRAGLEDENTVSRRAEQIGENVVEAGRLTLEHELESALTKSVRTGIRSLVR